MESMAERLKAKTLPPENKTGTINEKICPFMSTPDKQVACTAQCKLYKHNKHGYECPIQELTALSFQMKTVSEAAKRI